LAHKSKKEGKKMDYATEGRLAAETAVALLDRAGRLWASFGDALPQSWSSKHWEAGRYFDSSKPQTKLERTAWQQFDAAFVSRVRELVPLYVRPAGR
jgi:hypothetical protein